MVGTNKISFGAGFAERLLYSEACATLHAERPLVHLEDLVLLDGSAFSGLMTPELSSAWRLRFLVCPGSLSALRRSRSVRQMAMQARTRLFALPSAGLNTKDKLGEIIDYWNAEIDKIASENDPDKLKPRQSDDRYMMRKFLPHLSTIFGLYEDMLRPNTIEEYIEDALADLPR